MRKAKGGSHVIYLKPGIERKQPHIHKVSETLRSNVENQIMELLENDLMEASRQRLPVLWCVLLRKMDPLDCV